MKEVPYRTRMTVSEDCIGYTDKDGIKHYGFFNPWSRFNCWYENAGLRK